MKYEITKEQILEIHDRTSVHNQEQLEEWFPEAFKTELEVGKWYLIDGNKCGIYGLFLLGNFSGEEQSSNYGFTFSGKWADDLTLYHNDLKTYTRLATPEEVETALINEAKKRGYKGGIKLSPLQHCSNSIDTEKEDVYKFIAKVSGEIGHRLELNGTGIYQDGKWAEILPQKKTVAPMEKALKIIAGENYICRKDLLMKHSEKINFKRGLIFHSETDNFLINESEEEHALSESYAYKYFLHLPK